MEVGDSIGQDGRYLIGPDLGIGGHARVQRARDLALDREVAIKSLLTEHIDNDQLVSRFEREPRIMAGIAHPNLVGVYDVGRYPVPFYVMEFVRVEGLDSLIARVRIRVVEALRYVNQILAGLGALHANGLIHRDVKPANVRLTEVAGMGTVCKLMNLGIAKVTVKGRRGNAETQPGTLMGSLPYMPVEQLMGSADIDARADLYSAGVTLYEMLTQRLPFPGPSEAETVEQVLRAPFPEPLPEEEVPEVLIAICRKAMSRNPSGRNRSAAGMAGAGEAALDYIERSATRIAPRATLKPPQLACPDRPRSVGSSAPLDPLLPRSGWKDRSPVTDLPCRGVQRPWQVPPALELPPPDDPDLHDRGTRFSVVDTWPERTGGSRRRLLWPVALVALVFVLVAGVLAAILAAGGSASGQPVEKGAIEIRPATRPGPLVIEPPRMPEAADTTTISSEDLEQSRHSGGKLHSPKVSPVKSTKPATSAKKSFAGKSKPASASSGVATPSSSSTVPSKPAISGPGSAATKTALDDGSSAAPDPCGVVYKYKKHFKQCLDSAGVPGSQLLVALSLIDGKVASVKVTVEDSPFKTSG